MSGNSSQKKQRLQNMDPRSDERFYFTAGLTSGGAPDGVRNTSPASIITLSKHQ
jgi:hypothetical protein